MATIALYGRISSDKQVDNFSIETQFQLMRAHAEKEGHDIIELPEVGSAFTEGLSRSKLREALELAKNGKIQVLMFFSPDRFTRDMADGVILRRELRRYNVKLVCFHPYPREINEDMEIMHILTDWQSQQYVMKLRDASMRSIKGKAELELYTQGNVAFGYRIVGKKHDTRIEIVEEEAEVIHFIYELYLYHQIPVTEILERVKATCIPARKGTWTINNIRKILTKEVYTGIWYAFRFYEVRQDGKSKWKQRPKEEGIPIPMPIIIERDMWEAVQKRLATRRAGRDESNKYLMSGRLVCSCGRASIGQKNNNGRTNKDYLYYRCNSISQQKNCGMKKFLAPEVDETVWQFAYELIREPERLLSGLLAIQEEDKVVSTTRSRQIETLTHRLAELEEELTSIVEQRTKAKAKSLQAILDEKAEEYAQAIDGLTARMELLRRENEAILTDESIRQMAQEIDALRELYEALDSINETADFSARRALITHLNLRGTLRVDDEGQKWVDIEWIRGNYPRKLWTQNKIGEAA